MNVSGSGPISRVLEMDEKIADPTGTRQSLSQNFSLADAFCMRIG